MTQTPTPPENVQPEDELLETVDWTSVEENKEPDDDIEVIEPNDWTVEPDAFDEDEFEEEEGDSE